MKITEKDMRDPLFWRMHGRAEKAVHATLPQVILDTANDREAKAIGDAIDALTKAMLIAWKAERAGNA